MYNKIKIVNDPVHGFITIPSELHYDLIQHPYFQRLNRIKQLGMSYMVYPGAQHTRFQHSLGAMHLMEETIAQLRSKGNEITEEESNAVLAAILLHDIGHAPFSHVLESTITQGISHEEISLLMMQQINKEMGGALDLALQPAIRAPMMAKMMEGSMAIRETIEEPTMLPRITPNRSVVMTDCPPTVWASLSELAATM